MAKDFAQLAWNDAVAEDCRQLVRLAVREDLDRFHDWTTVSLVPDGATASAALVAREALTVAGMPAAMLALAEMDRKLTCDVHASDGQQVAAGTTLAILAGPARSLLTAERTVLNIVGRLCGVATLTRQYVDAVAGTAARIYDTRKTTPGWRRLEKYAVHCGGGHNHRLGLYDAILIKDNHLAFGAQATTIGEKRGRFTPAEAVRTARAFLLEMAGGPLNASLPSAEMIVEVEVDSLAQLAEVLPATPDIVLLDNMSCDQLVQSVRMRDDAVPAIELEASGGVNLETIRRIAETGVDRISVGRLTHSAVSRDVALDWR